MVECIDQQIFTLNESPQCLSVPFTDWILNGEGDEQIDRQINLTISDFSCNLFGKIYFTGFSSNAFCMISPTSPYSQFSKFTNLFLNSVILSIGASARNGLPPFFTRKVLEVTVYYNLFCLSH